MFRDVRRAGPGRAAALVAACLALTGLAGCGSSPQAPAQTLRQNGSTMSSQTAQRGTPGPVRTDPDPLTSRFPALGVPRSVTWHSGTLGDAPGPTSYWLDAVVELAPDAATTLRAAGDLQPVAAPELDAALASAVPAGTWRGGRSLDKVATGGGFSGTAFLADDAAVLVLRVRGGN